MSQQTIIEYLSRKDAAEMVGVSLPTISNWLRAGLFPHYKFGGAVRIRRDEFEAFIENSRRNGGAA